MTLTDETFSPFLKPWVFLFFIFNLLNYLLVTTLSKIIKWD
jgi:hypothetical protein